MSTTVATLRTKATLENMLTHANDRNRYMQGALSSIDAILRMGLAAQTMADAIAEELEKVRQFNAEATEKYRKRGERIDARRYPDEDE
ncbi:MAG: hypothetical protein L0H10_02735 [Comamonas sp.]|uniref:hypothetical protein n=1 Tax=Comamonas sp. TaxID=34028 RepID=UPI0000D7C637|nr:hypothetical protein [Comamonas sp.]MDN5502728.1 hypothetical protein [Comamonas sp.]MDN5540553.1 hypothetical protein [Comamonas sp.]CAJ43295.1 hypothetical protein [uncultured bacterium]